MDGFKEFQGKDLDAAIQDACLYFNASRERLEIEILQDAKSGIFGIVGARKAKIRARRACLRDTVQSVLGELSGHTIKKTGSPGERGERALPDPARRTARSGETDQSQDHTASVSPETARSRQRRTQGQTAWTEGRAEDRTDNRTAATAPSEASAASGARPRRPLHPSLPVTGAKANISILTGTEKRNTGPRPGRATPLLPGSQRNIPNGQGAGNSSRTEPTLRPGQRNSPWSLRTKSVRTD